MHVRYFALCCAGTLLALLTGCTDVKFNNPIDSRGANYAGDSAAMDSNGDGVADYFDPRSSHYLGGDTVRPVITLVGPETLIVAKDDPRHLLASLSARASDNLDGNLTDSIKMSGGFFASQCSTFTVVYTVADAAGNAARARRTIIVDCDPPLITVRGDSPLFVTVGGTFTDAGATASDNVDGDLTSRIVTGGIVSTAAEAVDTITYTVADRAGNAATATRVVKVQNVTPADRTPPTLTLKGANPMSLRLGDAYVEPGYTAVDNVDGTLTDSVKVAGVVHTSRAGTDTLVYTVHDKAGNVATQKRLVRILTATVKDTTAPVILLLGNAAMSISVNAVFADPGCTATDDVDGDITSRVTKTGIVNTLVAGTYSITYAVADNAGNPASATRTVYVRQADTTAPAITLQGAAACTVTVGTNFADPGVVAVDNVDGTISGKVVRTVKDSAGRATDTARFTAAIGRYTITYAVSDNAGNAAAPVTRAVIVRDTTGTGPGGDLLTKYHVPAAAPLGSLSTTFSSVTTDGAIGIGSVKDLQFQWSLERNVFDYIAFDTQDGVPNYHLPLMSTVTQHLNGPGPWLELTNCGIASLDGQYYVTGDATQLVWVKKDGSGAIVFR